MANGRDIGGGILDFIDVTIDRVTGNIQAGTDENAAKVAILNQAAERIRTETELRRTREAQTMQIIKVVSFAVVLILFIIVVSKYVVPLAKK